jgi:hypothetical protein
MQNLANCEGNSPWTPSPSPMHLQVEVEAQVENYRLCNNDQREPKSAGFGHACMTQDMKQEPILQMGSDKMIRRHVYDKPYMIRFPDSSEFLKHRRTQCFENWICFHPQMRDQKTPTQLGPLQ